MKYNGDIQWNTAPISRMVMLPTLMFDRAPRKWTIQLIDIMSLTEMLQPLAHWCIVSSLLIHRQAPVPSQQAYCLFNIWLIDILQSMANKLDLSFSPSYITHKHVPATGPQACCPWSLTSTTTIKASVPWRSLKSCHLHSSITIPLMCPTTIPTHKLCTNHCF